MKIMVCVDYDNLSRIQKAAGMFKTINGALLKLPTQHITGDGECEVRLYGGWFEEENMSQLSQDITVQLQNEFPSIIRIPTQNAIHKIVTKAVLALSLLEEPNHHLFYTYRRKGKPNNIRVETPLSVGCSSTLCPLPMAKKLLQKGSCPTIGCVTEATSLVYRHEQKLVDTMLTCDLLYLSVQPYDLLVLISADDDFLPPIRTLVLKGAKIVRIHPQASTNRKPVNIAGRTLLEVEL